MILNSTDVPQITDPLQDDWYEYIAKLMSPKAQLAACFGLHHIQPETFDGTYCELREDISLQEGMREFTIYLCNQKIGILHIEEVDATHIRIRSHAMVVRWRWLHTMIALQTHFPTSTILSDYKFSQTRAAKIKRNRAVVQWYAREHEGRYELIAPTH